MRASADRHAQFLRQLQQSHREDMLSLIAEVRGRVEKVYGVKLENEVVVWTRKSNLA